MTTQTDLQTVAALSPLEVAEQVGTMAPEKVANAEASDEVKRRVMELLERVRSIGGRDIEARNQFSSDIKSFGAGVRKQVASQSDLLNAPVNEIMNNSGDNGTVAKDLLELRKQVEKVNPNKFDFSDSWLRRTIAKLPGIGTKLEAWWSQYQAVSTVINDILESLEAGKRVLEKDNITLKADRDQMIQHTYQLQDQLQVAMLVDKEMVPWANSLETAEKKYIEEEVLYYLRQEVEDMQLSLGAANQAILVSDIIRRGNEELIRSTDRTLNVSAKALATAAALEVALGHQRKQLEAVQATRDMTAELMRGTAKKAKEQGLEIIKQANDSTAMISALKDSFTDVIAAMESLNDYKQAALPVMQDNINTLHELNVSMKEHVDRVVETTQ